MLPCALVKYLVYRMAYDESTAWFRVLHCLKLLRPIKKTDHAHLHTVPDYSTCCMRIEMFSVWKRGSRAAGNIAFYREQLEKKIVANMISKYRLWYSYYSLSSFMHGHSFFHLDNPVPNPVETETISNSIQIQKINKIRPDWTLKSGSFTPLPHRLLLLP